MRQPLPLRCPARVLVALVVGVVGAMGLVAPPASAGEIIEDPIPMLTLTVEPGDRTTPGTILTLTAEVDDPIGDPVTGEQVRFSVDDENLPPVTLDADGRAQITVTPPQGAHRLRATYDGTAGMVGASDERMHSVLPETCADEAQPGAGAVVRHAYLVALHRCPEPAGYAYWVDRLDAGATAGSVAATLARSPEAIDIVVDDAYRRILGRPSDPAGRRVWAAKLRGGWTTSQLWAALAASPEMVGAAADTDALVALVFDRIVGRPADSAGRAYWRDRLLADGGALSPTWRALAVTAEVVDNVIADAYRRVLGRPATPTEAAGARATIRTRRGDWRPLVADLLGHAEASTYAQRYPDPEVDG